VIPDRRFLAVLAVSLAAVAVFILAVARWIAVPATVVGPSMEPTLRAGDRVIVDLWTFRRRAPEPGEIVLFRGPGDLPMVKRVVRVEVEVGIEVVGDAPGRSRDSREFGPVPLGNVRGRVVWRYWPPSGWGPIR